jgi:hypothetical protein
MKITLSKSQWQLIGQTTGWLKNAQSDIIQNKKCKECHGKGFITTKLKNLGTLDYNEHIISCPSCSGKGYITKEDEISYMHSICNTPCPHCNCKTAQKAPEEKEEKKDNIALTILKQLGGNKFLAMTGAKNLINIGNGLSFKLPGAGFTKNGINYVKIILSPNDTYNIEFGKIRGTTYKIINTINEVYFDQLQEIFTSETGLDTHL